MKLLSIRNNSSALKGKRILLRLDLNVPLKGSRIADDYKLTSVLPTLRYLLRLGCHIVIVTHLGDGRPSVKPLAQWLSRKLKVTVPIFKKINPLKPVSGLAMLENIRRFKGELTNSAAFAKELASLAEVYVNDAFAVSHRAQASVAAVKNYLPAYAGLLLAEEIKHLERAKNPRRPLVLIMGGAKVKTKLPLLKALASRAQAVLIGGQLANELMGKKLPFKNIVLPRDGRPQLKKMLDIGPLTVAEFIVRLSKAKTIIWNGPLGMFENKIYSRGNRAIARAVAKLTKGGAFSLIGGGETSASVGNLKFSWVSTGGGATLAYLSGQTMPGLDKLIKS
jgi:3-phosphoglycerate kinase